MSKKLLALTALAICVSFIIQPSATAANRLDSSDISKPDFFPIFPWGPEHGWRPPFIDRGTNGLASIADCGFNVAGFVFASDLRECKKLGLGAILRSDNSTLIPVDYHRQWRNLSDKEIEDRVRKLVEAGKGSDAVKGYFIMDEPGVQDFSALGKAVAAVKKYAPGKLAYINLFPDYATIGAPDRSQLGTSNYTEYLERFVSEVNPQLISCDNYMVQISNDLTDVGKAASYYKNLLEVRRVALRHDLPFLNIVSANQIRPFTTVPSPANLRFQSYTTLAAGYRGVTWYTYYSGGYGYAPIDPEGRKTLTWFYLKEVNREVATLAPVMSRLRSTGVYFSKPAPFENAPLLPGQIITSVNCATPVMVGEFKHTDGADYAMIVNLSLEKSAKFHIESSFKNASIISAADGSLSLLKNNEGWLVPGQGLLLCSGK